MSVHADPPPAIVSEPHGINYATSNQLGKGGFAICYKAERLDGTTPTGHQVALKIVKTKMEPAKLAQKFITELQIHSKLSHPNIVAFHRAFSFVESTYVVLELCSSGSLADLLKKRKCVTMPEIRRFMIQVCGAVKYLHTRNIVHRDLKTGNLFLDENMNIKVGDFGLAALLVSGKDMDAKRRTTMCGTPNYLAPEILEKGKGHSEKVDLWAIGIISYTLAVGKAPFHAASKEEIYKKLKTGEYSWPELSSITNDISADLRDLVSTLLVPEELRPSPDKIVSHPFFKIAYVPTKMSRFQTTKTPTWPIQLPSPEAIQRGYSDSWWAVCKETGVGEYEPGRCFQLGSSRRIRSVVKDIEKEVAAGRQPVIPIPYNTVYTPFPCSGSWAESDVLTEAVEEKEYLRPGRQLKEISGNELHPVQPAVKSWAPPDSDAKRKRESEMMPPPRVRNGLTVRKTRPNPAEPMASLPENVPVTLDVSAAPRTIQAEIVPPESRAEVQLPPTRAADPSLARRTRTLRRQPSRAEVVPPVVAVETPALNTGAVRRCPSTRDMRTRKQAKAEIFEICSDNDERDPREPREAPPASIIVANTRPVEPRAPVTDAVLKGSDPSTVLQRLADFRDNLAAALKRQHLAPAKRRIPELTTTLPFVSRWVDYSRKHGVGYVLDDGTVGFIASSVADATVPVTHVAVRSGERWLRRIGKKFENIDKIPFHVLENTESGIARSRQVVTTPEQRDRQRMLRVLWVKFGRYMSQSLNGVEEADGAMDKKGVQEDLQFVKFYQRMGNVGIWGFADGCLQLHFPDHTKFVFSADGLHVSATLVSVEGAAAMAATNELPARLLKDREVVEYPVASLLQTSHLNSKDPALAELVTANMFREKTMFLLQVLNQWLEGGGLGSALRGSEQLQWNGLWVKDHTKKVDWVTVGRQGGDDLKC